MPVIKLSRKSTGYTAVYRLAMENQGMGKGTGCLWQLQGNRIKTESDGHMQHSIESKGQDHGEHGGLGHTELVSRGLEWRVLLSGGRRNPCAIKEPHQDWWVRGRGEIDQSQSLDSVGRESGRGKKRAMLEAITDSFPRKLPRISSLGSFPLRYQFQSFFF